MNQEAMAGVLSAMKEYFDRSTRVLDEADSTFAPMEGMFTASQQVAHAAQTLSWFVQGALAPEGFDLDFERMDKQVRGSDHATCSFERSPCFSEMSPAAAGRVANSGRPRPPFTYSSPS
jgi:hypothetical protein